MGNADQSDLVSVYGGGESLPGVLPSEPMGLASAWFEEAQRRGDQPNANAMTLATLEPDGGVSARIVLCKSFVADPGYVVFYTNYQGRKGRALAANPRAAVVFHWDHQDRQVRIEGPVVRSPASESDAYFANRPWESKIGAWASAQSEPIASREQLLAQVDEAMARFGLVAGELAAGDRSVVVPRPAHWGGWRVWAERVELWVGGVGRVHDRARWVRGLRTSGDGFEGGPWSATRLSP